MPIWLQALVALALSTAVPFMSWTIVQIQKMKVSIAEIQTRCTERLGWLKEMAEDVGVAKEKVVQTDLNVTKIAAKLDVDI